MEKFDEMDFESFFDLLNSIEPYSGTDIELKFHYGTQYEDLDGSGYDGDEWELKITENLESETYFGTTLDEVCRKALGEI